MFDPEYEAWKGNIGPGAMLREMIRHDNEEREMAKKAQTPAGIKIDADVITLLQTGTWKETEQGKLGFVMPLTQDRKLYEKTAKVLTTLGGKWSRKDQATVFDDPDADVAVHEALTSGEYIDSKKLFQFFETPAVIASQMVELLKLQPGKTYKVMEPSAGKGALINAVAKACVDDIDVQLFAFELDATRARWLRNEFSGKPSQITRNVLHCDFLDTEPDGGFERVIMNPPFSHGQDMAHIQHAYKFLTPRGILVSIISPAYRYRTTKAAIAFRAWLDGLVAYVTRIELPPGSFKASGTTVSTEMLVVSRG